MVKGGAGISCGDTQMKQPPENDRESFSVFLGFPQGRLFVHSFCTSGGFFSVARSGAVSESGCSEDVRVF
jgi:hypothetical protein